MRLTLATWNWRRGPALALAAACSTGPAYAAEGSPALDGSTLSLWWVLPFAGLLLSVAAVPQLAPHFWHQHFGKVTAAWALLFLLPFAATQGVALAAGEVLHTALGEYLPFIILLFALFVISGGIRVRSNMVGTPPSTRGYSRSARRSPASPARPAPPCCWSDPSSRPTSSAGTTRMCWCSSSSWSPTSAAP